MKQNFYIQGIKCMSCVEKITNLLQKELPATDISFTDNNKKLEFNTSNKVELTTLNRLLSKIGEYSASDKSPKDISNNYDDKENTKSSYKPIYLIFVYLIITNLLISIKNPNLDLFMTNFMASFFLVFSFFKMLDLKGFAAGYSTYDLIAKKFYLYGYIYPFIELCFGIGYLVIPFNLYLNAIVFIVMLVSAIGVITAKLTKQKFYCACVGTFLKVPLGSIAIIENVLMVVMSLFMIIYLV
ncbi:MAG: MauE/DoxX family redox-associated membrane protein [Neisseriaceae bacterium]